MCPRCGRPGKKIFNGYCTKVHRELEKKLPARKKLECANCGAVVIRTSSQVSKSGIVYCPRCPKNGGENHYKFKGGQYINPAGYRMIIVKGTYMPEHIHVWQLTNKAVILKEAKAHVHHVNMVKLDNSPDNLLLLSDKEHGKVHRWMETNPMAALALLERAGNRQLWYPNQIQNLDLVKR